MTGHQRDFFDRQSRFEKAAGAFVAQVVKMQILDLQFVAGSREMPRSLSDDCTGILDPDLW